MSEGDVAIVRDLVAFLVLSGGAAAAGLLALWVVIRVMRHAWRG